MNSNNNQTTQQQQTQQQPIYQQTQPQPQFINPQQPIYQQQPIYGMNNQPIYQPMNPGFVPTTWGGQPVIKQNNASNLTDDEYQLLINNPTKFSIAITPKDRARAICNHRWNGRDLVATKNNNTGEVFCPLCGQSWIAREYSKEEVQETVEKLYNMMQTTKWLGDLPTQMSRDYYEMLVLLMKYPEVHEFAMKNFYSVCGQNGLVNADDVNPYVKFSTLLNSGNMNQFYAPNPYEQYLYQNGVTNPQFITNPQSYDRFGYPINQQPSPMYGYAPVENPMQVQQPMYQQQYAAQPVPQQQFPGVYYQQPVAQPVQPVQPQQPVYGYNPTFGNFQQQPQPAAQPAQPAQPQQPAVETKNEKVKV